MSRGYVAVHWNRRKVIYDLIIWLCIAVYLAVFIGVTGSLYRGDHAISAPIVLMRALSTCAFIMLTIVLCIGPLARLDRRFLPLLYNRRHLGVSTFIIALLHAAVAVYWYHAFGAVNPLVSVFLSGGDYPSALPFQALGAFALIVLFVLAATSHDYWNATLGAPLWKALHMAVYAAYTLVIAHIVFGALQSDDTGLLPWMAVASVVLVGGLHIAAAVKRSGADVTPPGQAAFNPPLIKGAGGFTAGGQDADENAQTSGQESDAQTHSANSPANPPGRLYQAEGNGNPPRPPFIKGGEITVCPWRDIPDNRAVTVDLPGAERVAVFRYDGCKLAAVSNVCRHQNGPLGEGRVIDGLITCPWHGYQYRPGDGCSPPPFTEKVPTYRLAVRDGVVLLDPKPLPAGTEREVVEVDENL